MVPRKACDVEGTMRRLFSYPHTDNMFKVVSTESYVVFGGKVKMPNC